MMKWIGLLLVCGVLAVLGLHWSKTTHITAANAPFDTVIASGRVMDPESGLDAIRNVDCARGDAVFSSCSNVQRGAERFRCNTP